MPRDVPKCFYYEYQLFKYLKITYLFDIGRWYGRFWENANLDQKVLKVGKV